MLFAVLLAVTQHWLVLGDVHLNPFDQNPTPSDYHADSNWALLRSTVAAMRKVDSDPQVVVIAGDELTHRWGAYARGAGQDPARAARNTFAQLANMFGRAFPRAQFLIVMGNNDDPCGDYSTAPDSPYLAGVAHAWAPLVNRRGAAPDFERTFSHGGYYEARLPGRNVAIVLDDVYWSFFFHPCGTRTIGDQQFKWFERALSSLPPGERAVPVLHIPPGVDASTTLEAHRFIIVPFWNDGARSRFERDMQQFSHVISFAIAAHMHRSDIRLVGGVPMLVVSSISPVYANNPSFDRLVFNDASLPADYTTYALDPYSEMWGKEFDFDRTFGVHAFDAAAVRLAHERIASDPDVRRQWNQAMTAGSYESNSLSRTWRAYWCAQEANGFTYILCAGDQRRIYAAYAVAAAIGAVVVWGVVWYSRRRSWKRRQSRSG